jgi:imidazolonepropionase-like amidohydrolase
VLQAFYVVAHVGDNRALFQIVAGLLQHRFDADLLLVDGNPIENVQLVENPAKNFLIIMKDGKIYKNALNP